MNKVNLLNAILSHLSDAQMYNCIGGSATKEVHNQINIAKAIILYIADDKTNLGRIDVDTEEINEMLRKVNLL